MPRHVRDDGSFSPKQPCSALEWWAEASRSAAAGRAGAVAPIARARGAVVGASDWDREHLFPIPIRGPAAASSYDRAVGTFTAGLRLSGHSSLRLPLLESHWSPGIVIVKAELGRRDPAIAD
jgi:hypothetical protein